MLNFVQPLWMLAAAGIMVPVLIHLWNIREGKTLKIGSVSLLEQSQRQQASSFRLRDILLLVLRCLLLLLLAAMLAQPVWLQKHQADRQKGWILVEKQTGGQLYVRFKMQIDSLAKAGFQLRYFEKNFAPANRDSLEKQSDIKDTPDIPYWILLQQLVHHIPAGLPVYLYTGNRLNRFRGSRPALPLNLHWQAITPADSVSTWLQSAMLTAADSLRITKAESRPASTGFVTENTSALDAARQGYHINMENGKLLVSMTGSTADRQVEADTAATRISIFTDSYAADAAYLQAALSAIKQFTQRRMQVQLTSSAGSLLPASGWLFWLSDKPLPPGTEASNIFQYAGGKLCEQQSWINEANVESSDEPIALYKSFTGSVASTAAAIVWQDGFGHPLLTKRRENGTAVYSFYSRFDPQWNDLPWSSRFPLWMTELVMEQKGDTGSTSFDKRAVAAQQMMPLVVPAARHEAATELMEKTDLAKPIWIAAFLILLLERGITYKNKKPA